MTHSELFALTGVTVLLTRARVLEPLKSRLALTRYYFPYCGMCLGTWVGLVYSLLHYTSVGHVLLNAASVSLSSYLVSVSVNALETYTGIASRQEEGTSGL